MISIVMYDPLIVITPCSICSFLITTDHWITVACPEDSTIQLDLLEVSPFRCHGTSPVLSRFAGYSILPSAHDQLGMFVSTSLFLRCESPFRMYHACLEPVKISRSEHACPENGPLPESEKEHPAGFDDDKAEEETPWVDADDAP